jgi:hypothetical protein
MRYLYRLGVKVGGIRQDGEGRGKQRVEGFGQEAELKPVGRTRTKEPWTRKKGGGWRLSRRVARAGEWSGVKPPE